MPLQATPAPPPHVLGAARALAGLFGLGEPIGMADVARGAMGAVWRLETAAGVFAAKELFWFDGDVANVRMEVAFSEACADVGVRSPRPLPGVDGEYVVRHGGGWWRMYEWADGETPDQWDADIACWLATQMATIHTLNWPGGEVEPVPWYHRVDADWAVLAKAAESAKVDWAEALQDIQPRLVELTSLVNAVPVGEPVWCHRDLQNTNVLRPTSVRRRPTSASRPSFAEGNWLVDWDNVGPLAPQRELGALLTRHLNNPANLRRIVTAYRAAGGPAAIDSPAGFATGLAISLNFLHGQANATLDPNLAAHHRHFAHNQVTAVLNSLPTLERLEQAAHALHR